MDERGTAAAMRRPAGRRGHWRFGALKSRQGPERGRMRGARQKGSRRHRHEDRCEAHRAPRRPDRHGAIELLRGFDDMESRKWQVESNPDPLPGGSGAEQKAIAQRWHVERLGPALWGKQRLAHQVLELRAAEGLALTERGGVDAGPEAAAVWGDDDDAPAWRQDAPDLVQELRRALHHLE